MGDCVSGLEEAPTGLDLLGARRPRLVAEPDGVRGDAAQRKDEFVLIKHRLASAPATRGRVRRALDEVVIALSDAVLVPSIRQMPLMRPSQLCQPNSSIWLHTLLCNFVRSSTRSPSGRRHDG